MSEKSLQPAFSYAKPTALPPSPELDPQISEQIQRTLEIYADADRDTLTSRIAELDLEWDIDRILAVNTSSLTLSGLLLGVFGGRRWLLLPTALMALLAQRALQGTSPLMPVLRALNLRTRQEIEEEKYALKVLRGDFQDVRLDGILPKEKAQQARAAVQR